MNKIKVGILCFENPFVKPSTGGKRCILSRIYSLLLIDNIELDIYLVNMKNDLEANINNIYGMSRKIKNVYQYRSRNSIAHLFSAFPICNNRRYLTDCINELSKHKYDFFIYEGEQVAKYRFKNRVNSSRHIIYMHDIESNYRLELSKAQNNVLLRLLQKRESNRFKYIEKNINKLFDDIWFISKDELKKYQYSNKTNKGRYIPLPSVDALEYFDDERVRSKNILYIGDLKLKNNLLSIKWFVESVFPLIKKKIPDSTLEIVGRISEIDKQSISGNGVNVLGYVDDINSMYSKACCFVCPVLYGAGVKVKTIDALSKGNIVVTTSKGIEGTELLKDIHLVVEDDPITMAEKICDILENAGDYVTMAKTGWEFVTANHSIINQRNIIERSFREMMSN